MARTATAPTAPTAPVMQAAAGTAAGKITAARLVPGARIVVDLMPDRHRGGDIRPAFRKSSGQVATVIGAPARWTGGRARAQVMVVTDLGTVICSSSQTFFLAPTAAPAKATPAAPAAATPAATAGLVSVRVSKALAARVAASPATSPAAAALQAAVAAVAPRKSGARSVRVTPAQAAALAAL